MGSKNTIKSQPPDGNRQASSPDTPGIVAADDCRPWRATRDL